MRDTKTATRARIGWHSGIVNRSARFCTRCKHYDARVGHRFCNKHEIVTEPMARCKDYEGKNNE